MFFKKWVLVNRFIVLDLIIIFLKDKGGRLFCAISPFKK
ncbi:hypothetical protein L930_06390 [Helicobacter pylori PZ5004]|nr:hypothetical protein hp908_1581 [Helicobacter pylori 908]ADZ50643.1 hypothetical protein hp2017_1518 [Helicobacter pylori 2017]ADZ52248.1 hypothetical protein hp2018_1524 [Helicobacter pylori 2018]EQD97040.1 hypothetical protein L930_06390 [Helicobacter pylori PZ5004]